MIFNVVDDVDVHGNFPPNHPCHRHRCYTGAFSLLLSTRYPWHLFVSSCRTPSAPPPKHLRSTFASIARVDEAFLKPSLLHTTISILQPPLHDKLVTLSSVTCLAAVTRNEHSTPQASFWIHFRQYVTFQLSPLFLRPLQPQHSSREISTA